MSTHPSGISALWSAHTERHHEAVEHRRIEHELANFVTESEKAELSAILERNADGLDDQIEELISERVLSPTEYRVA